MPNSEKIKNWLKTNWVHTALFYAAACLVIALSIYYFGSNHIKDSDTRSPAPLHTTLLIMSGIWSAYALWLATQKDKITQEKAAIIAITATVWVIVLSINNWDWLTGENKERNNDVLRTITLTIGGIWGLYALYLATQRTKIIAETQLSESKKQVSESIGRAAEQLASDVISVRILAILSLGKIATEGDKQTCQDIIEVLCAYIRGKRPVDNEGNKIPWTEDMDKIIEVLSKIQREKSEYSHGHINLSHSDLSRVDLSNADLRNANLLSVDLSNAFLFNTALLDADLSGAHLSNAFLGNANLSGANLSSAKLSDADFSFATLRYATLSNANLSGANLSNADMSDAVLHNVRELDIAIDLETVQNPPQAILTEIERRRQVEQNTPATEQEKE